MIWLVIKLLIKLQNFQKLEQNNSETVTNKHDKETAKKTCISKKKTRNYWWTKVKIVW